jgi:uncharacterized protein (TIGR02186 family)
MKMLGILIAIIFCTVSAGAASAQDAVQLSVEPKVIDIDAFFNGSSLTATGSIPKDSQAIVRFMGAACDLHMKRKGKAFGIMWMNLDSLSFRGVPNVCIVSSAVDFDSLKGDMSPGIGELERLQLSGLKEIAMIDAEGVDSSGAFEELLKLKKNEGLYRESIGNVTYEPGPGDSKKFQAGIPIPSRLSPGEYFAELSVIKDGKIIAQSRQPVTVKLIGFPALLAKLAFGSAALYGVLATVIAILSGLAIGMVFQSKGAH